MNNLKIQKQKGFTLIELLLVIAIVTLLTSVFIFNSTEAKKKADDSHMVKESREVEKAILLYKDSNDGFVPYSTQSSWGNTYQEGIGDDYENNLQPLVDAKILPSVPRSPDGSSYAYGISENGQEAIFIANLKSTKVTYRKNSNSCTFIESSNENQGGFGACTPYTDIITPLFYPVGGTITTFVTCSAIPRVIPVLGRQCFDKGSYESYCQCATDSNSSNPSVIPNGICQNYCSLQRTNPSQNDLIKIYLCEVVESEPETTSNLCDNDSDFCRCI